MLVQEILTENPDLIKTYSDAGFLIQQIETGVYYEEAIDPIITHREYIETNIPIDSNSDESKEAELEQVFYLDI